MSDFAWTDDLSVGVEILDQQHRQMIDMIRLLADEQLPADRLADTLESLLAYAAQHFRDEEEFIVDHAPHLIERHLPQHTAFIEKVYDFVHAFNEGRGPELREEVHGFLCQWWGEHIVHEDHLYAAPTA